MAIAINRLFFALWPDDAVRAACAEAVRSLRVRMSAEGRAQSPEKFHLTLAFLGNTLDAAQEAAARAVADQLAVPPFALALDQAGSFRRREHTWWLGCAQPPAALLRLHEALRDGLAAAKLPAERGRFVPHLTFLRDARGPLPPTPVRPIAWGARDFVLVRSRLDRQPPDYEIVGRWPLRAPDPAPGQLGLWENAGSGSGRIP